jgi:DedD protein
MDQPLKQRLIGATILICLAVIFIPMFIGEEPAHKKSISIEIPEPPKNFDSRILPLPEQKTEELAEVQVNGKEPVKIIKPIIPEPPKVKTVEGITAWVVQVGSFSDEKNANRLSDTLKKAGYTAFVESSSSNNKDIYRVRVGPEISKEKAESLSEKIKKQQTLSNAIVVQYP